MKYKVSRICEDCGNIDSLPLAKIEAAFELYNSSEIWNLICTECSSTKCKSTYQNKPDIDKELLDLWGNDPTLFFMEQDEDLMIANIENLNLILEVLDEKKYTQKKNSILIQSLCALLYDNIISPEEYSEKENVERRKNTLKIIPELVKRKATILECDIDIMDYIKVEVYPQIGLQNCL